MGSVHGNETRDRVERAPFCFFISVLSVGGSRTGKSPRTRIRRAQERKGITVRSQNFSAVFFAMITRRTYDLTTDSSSGSFSIYLFNSSSTYCYKLCRSTSLAVESSIVLPCNMQHCWTDLYWLTLHALKTCGCAFERLSLRKTTKTWICIGTEREREG